MALTGNKPLAPTQSYQVAYPEDYMKGTDYNDPLVAPVAFPDVLSSFPPTLVISGTRDIGLSEAIYTHTQLVKAGVQADLHVWEGMWHCFFHDADLPESREVYTVIESFFDKHLGVLQGVGRRLKYRPSIISESLRGRRRTGAPSADPLKERRLRVPCASCTAHPKKI